LNNNHLTIIVCQHLGWETNPIFKNKQNLKVMQLKGVGGYEI